MRIFIVLLVSSFSSGLFAQSFVWTGGTSTDWGVSTNWTPTTGAPPNGAGAGAVFSTSPPPANQPNLTASVSLGSIQFSATGAGNTISAILPHILTLQASSGTATISSSTAGNEISAPIALASDVVATVSSNLTLTLSGVVSGASSLTVGGGGTVALTNGANTISGTLIANGGILQAISGGALGTSAAMQITSGTFQAAGTLTTPATVVYTLSEAANFDSNSQTMTILGPIHGTALTKIGAGILSLQGISNDYTGGTTVSGGTLSIYQDGSLGEAAGAISLATGTVLQAGQSFALGATRSVSIEGSVTIDTNGNHPAIAGPIIGTGSLSVTGIAGNTLLLSGTNTYTGPTNVDLVTLQGNTTSLQGAIHSTATGIVTFEQAISGTYAGAFNGAVGSILNIQGGAIYTFSGNSASSLSTTNLTNAQLILSGSLGTSTLTIDSASNLTGTGSLATTAGVTNQGKITPGSSGSGTLSVTGGGGMTLTPGSGILVSQLNPLTNGLLHVAGTATLTNGILDIQPDITGFYGLTRNYTLLTAGSRVGAFGTVTIPDPNFAPTLTYTPTEVQLLITILRPFHHFPFANANERAVGSNIDALHSAGLLSPDMVNVIDSLAGQSNAAIDNALDQMHPAALSALAELQTELGGQLLSLFHRRPALACSCANASRLWVEPFGNWLKEKRQGMEIGFNATTRGVALGVDRQFFGCWTLGLGGAYSATDLQWTLDRGYAYTEGAYGSLYSDVYLGNFYLGASAYVGKDWYETIRQIHFAIVDRQAKADSHSFDLGGQLTTAYFFGSPACLLYPYATVDYLYLKNSSFSESGAISLNLNVDEYTSSTLRGEAGAAIRFVDRNRDETICISPIISMGYVLELPLHRDHYHATFSGEPIPFATQGWDMAWQLLNLRFGLGITYRCFTLDSQYSADISPERDSAFLNQRANFKFIYSF